MDDRIAYQKDIMDAATEVRDYGLRIYAPILNLEPARRAGRMTR